MKIALNENDNDLPSPRTVLELINRDRNVINDRDEASNTALHLAAIEGHIKCCKALLENGAEVDARCVEIP